MIIKAWMGFVDNKPHFFSQNDYYDGVFRADLFVSKKSASRCYQDVRQVEVKFVPNERPNTASTRQGRAKTKKGK